MHPSKASAADRPVIILGSGRCGSTLLQAILNTNPEFLIWGEHNGLLRQIAAAYFDIFGTISNFPDELTLDAVDRMQRLKDRDRTTAWDNLFNREGLIERFRIFLRSMFADPTGRCPRWGFKEIRYGRGSADLVLPLLRECFPAVKFVFLVREPYSTLFSMLSAWFYVRTSRYSLIVAQADRQILRLAHLWARTYTYFHTYLHAYPSEATLVRYENLHQPETYELLAHFLDTAAPFDYAPHVAMLKDAAVKDDETAAFIRERINVMRPRIDGVMRQTRLAFGYRDP